MRLSPDEVKEANAELTLAHPQWEKPGVDTIQRQHNRKCNPCGVLWFSTDEDTRCWMCGGRPVHNSSLFAGGLPQPPREHWEYEGQPITPDSGCGCDDDTPAQVARLIAAGWDLHAACLITYGRAA